MASANAPAEKQHWSKGKPLERMADTANGKRRAAAGLTKERLSELSGVGYRTLWDWEHGVPVSERTRQAIDKALTEAEKEMRRETERGQ